MRAECVSAFKTHDYVMEKRQRIIVKGLMH